MSNSPIKHSIDPQATLAILIGIAEYDDFENIAPATNNVHKLSKVLQDDTIVGIPEKNVHPIVGGSSAEIKEQLFDLTEGAGKRGILTLVFYFTGHGFRRPSGEFLFTAKDSKKRLLRADGSTGIAYNTVKQIIKNSGIPQSVLLLDACYSGSTIMGEHDGFEQMKLRGSYIISSSDSLEVSYFDTDHSHTLFTGELLEILRNGLSVKQEKLTLEQLYQALHQAVRSRNRKMSPQQQGSKEITGSNYLFFRNRQYDASAHQINDIETVISEGDLHLDNKEFQSAEYKYLKAKQLAEEFGIIEGYHDLLIGKIQKLRLAEELDRKWGEKQPQKRKQRNLQSSPRNGVRKRKLNLEQIGNRFLKRRKVIGGISALLLIAVLAPYVYRMIDSSKKEGTGQRKDYTETIGDVKFEMVRVEGGSFQMGSPANAEGSDDDERPQHEVRVPTFLIGKYPVTQAQWRAVMGSDPENLVFKGCDDCPVDGVSWDDVQGFLKELNHQTGKTYRLPSESEWEYAAGGGIKTKAYKYAGSNDLNEVGWYQENSKEKTHPVGGLSPNELGLYDMSGNVWEWCQDHWHKNYEEAPADGSTWEDAWSLSRVLRGGSWYYGAQRCRVTCRHYLRPGNRHYLVGFRLAHST